MENIPAKLYDRWDFHQRLQHWLMMISFTLLAVTGLLIKFAYTPWAQAIAKIFITFEILFSVHLAAALLMMVSAVYHLIYLIGKGVRRSLRGSMLPGWQDIKDLACNIGLFCGVKKEGPRFSKYSYKEKVEYLAEYWGTPVMILSGFILWYPGVAAAFLPRWAIESAHFVHQGEGLLAILVIFIWHLYSVHFTPDFFPMNKVWLTGKVSRAVMEHEYPLELARLEQEEQSKEEQSKEEQGKEEQSKEEQSKEEQNKEEQDKEEQSKEEQGKEEQNKEEQDKEEQSKEGQNKEDQNKEEQSKEEQNREEQNNGKQVP